MAESKAMTAQDATRFDTYSIANAVQVEESLECGCLAYEDVFTYQRWAAQGLQVRRGEHGVKITTWVPKTDKGTGEVTGRWPHTTTVFCRHQVEPVSD